MRHNLIHRDDVLASMTKGREIYASQAYHGTEATGQFVKARANPPQFFHPTKVAFDDISLPILRLVKPSRQPWPRLSVHVAVADDGRHPMAVAVMTQFVTVVALVRDHIPTALARRKRSFRDVVDLLHVTKRSQ